MAVENDALLVAINHPRAMVIVRGRGTFKVAPSLKKFGTTAIEAGCRLLLLDMQDCIGMDSTFMGVIGGLAVRLRKELNGELAMVNLSVKNRALLATLGLDKCVRTDGAEAEMEAFLSGRELSRLETAPIDRDVTTQTMLDAHNELVSISSDNLAKFKDVIAYLQDEMQRSRDKDKQGG
ncbi:MAG: STAS domain-containing protein [Kiritimatiellia bacterium]